ncbi:MAG: hypothetical protein ABIV50_06340 [Opitutus sp.]
MQSTSRFPRRVSAALSRALLVAATFTPALILGKEIVSPLPIEGVVEVLNDTLYQPYVVTQYTGNVAVEDPTVYFDIPDGKRLIIETIAYQAGLPAGSSTRMFLQPLVGTSRQLIPLVIQDRVEAGGYYVIANVPFKMRIDSVDGSTNEIAIRRGAGGAGTLYATICGYLVNK